jgi:hypothetical protein
VTKNGGVLVLNTREEKDARAMQVHDLCKTMKQVDIAVFMGIHPVTVSNYKKHAKKLLRRQADNIDGKYRLADILHSLQKQANRALDRVTSGDPQSPVTVGFEKVLQSALQSELKILQESGFVFKMPESIEDGIPFDDPVIRKKYLELRAEARTRRLAAGVEQKRLEGKGK